MEGSIATNRMIRDADLNVRRQITDTGKEIDLDEVQAQNVAKMQYAQAMDKDELERRRALIGMVSPALSSGLDYAGKEHSMGVDKSVGDALKV